MNTSKRSLVFLLTSFFVIPTALALVPADPLTLLTAKSAGRGSSTAASTEQNLDGLILNPASLAFQSQYAISFGLSGMGGSLGASIVDTKSGPLGGGLYYIRRDLTARDPANLLLGNYRRIEDRAGLALFSKFSERFAMGVTGKYFYQTSQTADIVKGKTFNGDLSVSIVASPEVAFAFTIQNLLEDKSGAMPKAFVFGAELKPVSSLAISGQILNVSTTDLANDFELPAPNTLGWSLGALYRISKIELRTGYLRSGAWNRSVISGGIGYGDKNFSIDYALQYESEQKNQFHGLSVTGYL